MDCKIRRSEEKEAFKKLKLNSVPKNAVKNYRELDGSLLYPFLMTKPSGLYTKWEFSEDTSSEKGFYLKRVK